MYLGRRGELGIVGERAGPENLEVGPSHLGVVSVWIEPSSQALDSSAPSVSVAR